MHQKSILRSAAAKNLLAMLSCGETVFASNAEAKEFYSLANALGMDKTDMGAKRMTEKAQEDKEENGLEKQPQQQQHRHLRLPADHQVEMEIPDIIDIEKEDNHKENQEKAGANEEERGSEDKRKKKQPDISTKSQHMQGNNEETEEKYRELQSLIRKSRDGKGNTVKCPIPGCQVRYKNVNLIIQHMCGSHFRRELEKGRKAELEIGRRECLLCGSVMSSLFNLTCHYGIIHRDVVSLAWDRIAKPQAPWFLQEEEEEEEEAEPKEADPEEEKKKEKMERLKKLCKSSSGSGFSCFLCDSSGTFRTPPHLLSHLARLHFRQRLRDMIKNAQDEAGSVGRFDCGQCGEKLCSSSSLLNHCGVVHGWVVGMALEEERVMEKQQQQKQQQQQQHEQGGEVPVRGRQQLQQQKQQGQQQLYNNSRSSKNGEQERDQRWRVLQKTSSPNMTNHTNHLRSLKS